MFNFFNRSKLIASLILFTASTAVYASSINSRAYAIYDLTNGQVIESKNGTQKMPIASITKLMTAMVFLDKKPDLSKEISIEKADVDTLLHTTSRLKVGTTLTVKEALNLALMSSENRAASALSRNYPGGRTAFIRAMNAKAKKIGMKQAQFFDSTGLDERNQATALDLVQLVKSAKNYDLIKEFTTTDEKSFDLDDNNLHFVNTNPLVRLNNPNWNINVSKTGYTQKAGKCIVMLSTIQSHQYVFSILGSPSKEARLQALSLMKEKIKEKKA